MDSSEDPYGSLDDWESSVKKAGALPGTGNARLKKHAFGDISSRRYELTKNSTFSVKNKETTSIRSLEMS